MAKFKIQVVEQVTATYKAVEIEADTVERAQEIAEEMRVQGGLGDPQESVDDVFFRVPGR